MTNTAISPLRQRMIDDMTVRGFTPSTQRGYLVAVTNFAAFFGRPTCKTSVITTLQHPAKYSNPHRLYKPKQRA